MKSDILKFFGPMSVFLLTGCFDGYVSNYDLAVSACTTTQCSLGGCYEDTDWSCVRRKEASYQYCGNGNSVVTKKTICKSRDGFGGTTGECYEVTECTQIFEKLDPAFSIQADKAFEELNKPRPLAEALRNVDANEVAYSYRMSVVAVKNVLEAMALAAEGDKSKLLALGLTKSDLSELANYNVAGVPSSSYEAVAKNVDATVIQVKGLISKFTLIIKRLEKSE